MQETNTKGIQLVSYGVRSTYQHNLNTGNKSTNLNRGNRSTRGLRARRFRIGNIDVTGAPAAGAISVLVVPPGAQTTEGALLGHSQETARMYRLYPQQQPADCGQPVSLLLRGVHALNSLL